MIEAYIADEEISGNYWHGDGIGYANSRRKLCPVFISFGNKANMAKGSGRVLGLEAMSIAELKRPRIDATARITGMMRDSMPCVVTLLDKAVKLAASLDESDEINYISKHLKEDIEYLEQQGIVKEEAAKQAVHRIFGCPPGGYGAGVAYLLEEKTGKRSMTWHKSMFVGGTCLWRW